jgi:hypothetical protein
VAAQQQAQFLVPLQLAPQHAPAPQTQQQGLLLTALPSASDSTYCFLATVGAGAAPQAQSHAAPAAMPSPPGQQQHAAVVAALAAGQTALAAPAAAAAAVAGAWLWPSVAPNAPASSTH